ncbi:MAG: hypothetical protein JXA54_00160 [Candidatus Heimdallarchaeota archaeon]|nr:hypothetical protein [Candidatus Heimdallarchaeota archaeon]
MLDEFFILRKDGLTIFHIVLEEDSFTVKVPTDLFAGFSSAIVAFANELGSGQLSKIEIEDQIFVYNIKNDLITVAKISNNDDEKVAEHIVSVLEREFVKEYRDELINYDGAVRKDIFFPFSIKVREIISKCMKIALKNPHLLENIPPSIDLDAIVRLSECSDELLGNFPESTIEITREFQSHLPDDIMHYTMYKLGKEFGKDIVLRRLKQKANDKTIIKLLKEISICSYDKDIITLIICPFCRGRKVKEFDCDFISGFIEGAFDDSKISVREIKCHAVGDKYCQFRIFRN